MVSPSERRSRLALVPTPGSGPRLTDLRPDGRVRPVELRHVPRSHAGESAQNGAMMSVCLHEVPSRHPLRVAIAPDTSLPLDSGAFGKALLAFAPPEILDEVLAADTRSPGAPIEDRLRADLADIVTSGVARSVGEAIGSSVAIAVPIFREDGIVAAIGVVGPESRCGLGWRTRVARLLPGAASSVVGALSPGLSA